MAGYKNFGAETLLAADVNNYLMRQAVIRVSSEAELAEITAPEPGMMAYREDSAVTYRHDGSTWRAVIENTGWLDITELESGFSPGSPAPQVRLKNGDVYCRGRIVWDSPSTSNTPVLTLPPGFRPTHGAYAAPAGGFSSSQVGRFFLQTTGVLSVTQSAGNWAQLNLDSIIFSVD